MHRRNKSHAPFRSRSHRMRPSDALEQHEYLAFNQNHLDHMCSCQRGFGLTEHSLNELGNGRVDMLLPLIGRM